MTTLTLKRKVSATFPTLVVGAGGIKVTKVNGIWTISPDFAALTTLSGAAVPDPSLKQILLWDPGTGQYNSLTLAGLGDSLYKATSATSFAIGTGSKAFTTQTNKDLAVGTFVLISSDANPTVNYMYGQITAYVGPVLTVNVTSTAGAGTFTDWSIRSTGPAGASGAAGPAGPAGAAGALGTPSGRLSAQSGIAVTTADQTSVATLYYVALGQNKDPVYDGTQDTLRTIGTPSLTINATNNVANAQYDVYEIWDGTQVVLAAGVAWTSNGAGTGSRGTGAGTAEVTTFNGRRVNANSMTMKNGGTNYTVPANQGNLVGGFRVTGVAGATEDSVTKRFVWNEYNALPRTLKRVESTASWSYTTNSFHQANASTANQVEVFSGATGRPTLAQVIGMCLNSTATPRTAGVGIGINSTTVNSAALLGPATPANSAYFPAHATYNDYLPLGYNQIVWLEIGAGFDAQTWGGTLGLFYLQAGMTGQVIQ